ncbi:MAG: PAS domain S-box protein [Chloroflexota bacterium]
MAVRPASGPVAGELLRAALASLRDPVAVLEAVRNPAGELIDERILYANPAWRLAALGGADAPDPAGESLLRLVPAIADHVEIHRRVIDTGLPYDRELRVPGAGPGRWFHVEYSRLGDGLLLVAHDVTGEHDTRAQLEAREQDAIGAPESAQRFALAMEHTAVGMCIIAPDGRYLEVNDALCRMYGRDADTLRTMRWQDITYPDDLDVSQTLETEVLGGRRTSYRELKRYVRPDGTIVWVEHFVAPVRGEDGEVRHFVSQVMDVTDRIAAERALRVSEERYRTLVDEIDGVVFVRDEVTGEVFCSQQVERMLGYAAAEVVPPGAWRRLVVAEDAERVFAVWEENADADEYELEYRMRRKDGVVIRVEERWRSTRDAHGRITHWYGVTTDITRRQRLEEAAARTDRLEAVSRVAAAAALDFGTVLTAIQFYLGNLAETIAESDQRSSDVHGIGESVDRGVTLTRQLLAFGREVQDSEASPVDLDWLLADLEPILRGVAGSIPLAIHLEDRGLVRIGRATVEQILLVLVNNARDAMPDGGSITITVRRQEVGPDAGLPVATGPYFAIEVTDTGTGMTDEVMERAFEPLFTTKPNGSGTGLAQVYAMTRAAGGTVTLESPAGAGATVRLLLPDVGAEG